MKVTVISEKKKREFQPFKLEVTINSLEEAAAFATLAAGFNIKTAEEVIDMANVTAPKFPLMTKFNLVSATAGVGKAIRRELEGQGFI